jgi:hypothetical protein
MPPTTTGTARPFEARSADPQRSARRTPSENAGRVPGFSEVGKTLDFPTS